MNRFNFLLDSVVEDVDNCYLLIFTLFFSVSFSTAMLIIGPALMVGGIIGIGVGAGLCICCKGTKKGDEEKAENNTGTKDASFDDLVSEAEVSYFLWI